MDAALAIAPDVADVFELHSGSVGSDDRTLDIDHRAERRVGHRCNKNVLCVHPNTGENNNGDGAYRKKERSRRHWDLPEAIALRIPFITTLVKRV